MSNENALGGHVLHVHLHGLEAIAPLTVCPIDCIATRLTLYFFLR